MTIVKQQFTITYEREIDTDTGEIIKTSIIKTSDTPIKTSKKSKNSTKDESSEPELILESNKYVLNNAAITLMNVEPDCRLNIKYEKSGNLFIPVIGTDEAFGTKGGNKLNKSNSVSYRGNANTELSKYGTVFKIKAHPKTANLFILESENKQGDFSSDENIELPEDYDIENDISIDDFIEEASSISSMDFSIDNI